MKHYLTTGRFGKFCNVSAATVKKWCERGELKFQRSTGTVLKDRRIDIADAIRFMKEHQFTIPDELYKYAGIARVMVYGSSIVLPFEKPTHFQVVNNPYQLGSVIYSSAFKAIDYVFLVMTDDPLSNVYVNDLIKECKTSNPKVKVVVVRLGFECVVTPENSQLVYRTLYNTTEMNTFLTEIYNENLSKIESFR